MARESRVKKSLLNARVNLICYMASLVVAFFTRKVFLDQLGTEFIGLTGSLQSLLGFLNLAELGLGSAVAYVLYKPIFDGDRNKITEVISVFGYLYRCIGLVILSVGVAFSLFIPFIFPDTSFSWTIIYIGFYAYLVASLLGYFVNYRMVLLSADQRNYIVTGYFQMSTTSKVIIQMILAIFVKSFILYFSIELLFGIVNSIILNWKINKTYPWLASDIKLGKQLFRKYPEISKYVKQLFIHKIGGFVQYQVTPFLIYAYVSLPVVALYGNYTMLTQRMQGFLGGVLDSVGAGVGNLVSEGNIQKIYATFKELFSVRFFVCGVFSACILHLSSPFISVWLGNEYPLPNLIVQLIVFHFFLSSTRGVTDSFLNGYGLFYDVWAPVVESLIFICVSIIGGSIWGLSGLLSAPIISLTLIVHIWKPYFLYTKGFKLPFIRYLILLLKHVIPILLSYNISTFSCTYLLTGIDPTHGWINWFIYSSCFTVVMALLSIASILCLSPEFRYFVKRFVKI